MKLGIISTIWKRPRLTKLFLDYYTEVALDSGYDIEMIAVCSSDEDAQVVTSSGWNVIYADNQPITSKHNAGCEYFMDRGVDAVVNMPSDDFFTPGYFDFLYGALESGHDFVRFGSLYFASLDTGEALYAKSLYNAAGAMIGRPILEKTGYRPWTEDKTHATDAFLIQNIQKHFSNPLLVDDTLNFGFAGVDFKADNENLNSFDSMMTGLEEYQLVDLSSMLDHFPIIKKAILDWNRPRRPRIKKKPGLYSPMSS